MKCSNKIDKSNIIYIALLFMVSPVLIFNCSSQKNVTISTIVTINDAELFLNQNATISTLEQIAKVYEDTLNTINESDNPELYASLKNKQGLAYNYMAKKTNSETSMIKAVEAFEQAIKVRTKDKYPLQYATINNNLGTIYGALAKIRYKEENMTKAILVYERALDVFQVDKYPKQNAIIRNNLGAAFGALAEVRDTEYNLHQAIDSYNTALKIRTLEDQPQSYAITKNNLGTAFSLLSEVRDKKENLNLAINEFKEALTVFTPDQFSLDFASTKNNIGNAYVAISGLETDKFTRKELLKNAISEYQEALNVYTFQSFPDNYATTQNNLGTGYSGLAEVESPPSNMYKAIKSYDRALQVYSLEDYPLKYASTHNNRGAAYVSMSEIWNPEKSITRTLVYFEHSSKEKLLNESINSFREALKIREKEKYPFDYAHTQNNLGMAYLLLSYQRKANSNLQKALAAYEEALSIFTMDEYPIWFNQITQKIREIKKN